MLPPANRKTIVDNPYPFRYSGARKHQAKTAPQGPARLKWNPHLSFLVSPFIILSKPGAQRAPKGRAPCLQPL